MSLDNMAEKATTGVFEPKIERICSVWDASSFADLFWKRKFAYIFFSKVCVLLSLYGHIHYACGYHWTHPVGFAPILCFDPKWRDGFFVCKEYFFLVYCIFEMYFNRFIITDVINQIKNGGSIWSEVIVIQYM